MTHTLPEALECAHQAANSFGREEGYKMLARCLIQIPYDAGGLKGADDKQREARCRTFRLRQSHVDYALTCSEQWPEEASK